MQYYLYRHIRLDKNEPFYIGIGSKSDNYNFWEKEYKRAYSKFHRSNYWKSIVSKTEYEVEIMYESDDIDEIKKKEIEFIALYGRRDLGKGTLCNLTDGGDGAVNYIFTKNTKRPSTAFKKGIIPWNKGKNMPYHVTLSVIKANTGRIASKETCLKMSESHKKKGIHPNSLKTIKDCRWDGYNFPVIQYTKDNVKVAEYLNINDASTKLNCPYCSIWQAVIGKRKTYKKFIFKYKKDVIK